MKHITLNHSCLIQNKKSYSPPYVCPKCGSLISPTTKKCSKCGYVVK